MSKATLGVVAVAVMGSSAVYGLEIRPAPQMAMPEGVPMLALVREGDEGWKKGEPVWSGRSNDTVARAWFAVTEKALLCRIVVEDEKQENPYHERNLWRADCVYVSVDGRGDDEKGAMMADDAVYLLGLGDQGPECRVISHGNPAEMSLDQASLLKGIVRDEQAKTTTYEAAIPFARISTAIGQSPTIGVALNIAHKDRDGKDLLWGTATGSDQSPRVMNTLRLPAPAVEFATIAPKRTRLTGEKESAAVTVALRSSRPFVVRVQQGGAQAELKGEGSAQVQRFEVEAPSASIGSESAELVVRVVAGERAVSQAYAISTPRVAMDRFAAHVARLEATTSSEVLRAHLDSTLRVVRDAYMRLGLEEAEHPDRSDEFLNAVELIASKLPEERIELADYTTKCLPLVFAFVSEADRTLQYYSLQLPYGFDSAPTYPLTIYLHGRGDQNPVGFMTTSFDNTHQDTLFRTVAIDPANVPASHRGFVLAPWGRGNSMYVGYGEDDVWQSMELVKKQFKVDADRVYLTGFSMGCGGAMSIAGRRPDVFAGVNLASGFGGWSETSNEVLVDNIRGVALALWIGELDPMAGGAKAMHEQLTQKGMEHRYEVVARLPHTYPYLEYQKNVAYLMQYRRQRPQMLSYVADSPTHAGRNGIFMSMPRKVSDDARPSFTCAVSGQTVKLETKNTKGLSVQLNGEDGLGLTGDVVVIWNGSEAYKGPATRIDLGEAKVSEWDRR